MALRLWRYKFALKTCNKRYDLVLCHTKFHNSYEWVQSSCVASAILNILQSIEKPLFVAEVLQEGGMFFAVAATIFSSLGVLSDITIFTGNMRVSSLKSAFPIARLLINKEISFGERSSNSAPLRKIHNG